MNFNTENIPINGRLLEEYSRDNPLAYFEKKIMNKKVVILIYICSEKLTKVINLI